MKKMIQTAFVYAIAAMAGGVFFREFTKFNGFTGRTMLANIHPHLFALGTLSFLLLALFATQFEGLAESKKYRRFYTLFNIGMPITSVLMLVRGIFDVTGQTLSRGLDGAISGVAGIGHILTGVAIVFLMLALKEQAAAWEKR